VRASVVTTLLLLVVASPPGVVRAASTEGGFLIEGYPHVAAVPSRARVLVDDNGNTTSYAYDARDRGTYVVGADLTVQRSVYDVDSNVVETIDRNGTTIAYTHDADHRVVKAEVTRRATNLEGTGQGVEGTGVMAWEYDGLSRPRVCVDQNDPADPSDDVATSYTFDSLSRPLTERHRFRASTAVNAVFTQFGRISVNSAGIDKTISRTFDLDSNRTSTTYSSGRTLSYGLDGADRIQRIVEGALGAGPAIQTTEWLGGRPLQSDAGNGVRTIFGYDADRRLTSLAHVGALGAGPNVATFGHTWTRGNQRATETFSAAGLPAATQTYSYDSASRLIQVAFTDQLGAQTRAPTTWLIDGVGNQLKKEEDGQTTALNVRSNGRYLPDLMNEVSTLTRFSATAQFLGEERHVQDTNGSRIRDGQFRLYFDAFERLVRVARPEAPSGVTETTVARYRYDATARRVDRAFVLPGETITQQRFHIHDGDQEIEELDGSGALQADFVWGGIYVDQLVQLRRAGSAYHAHHNSVFSIVALTDASGAVAERYGYSSVYGACQVQNADGSSRSLASEVGNPWRFQGRRFDPETGWLYFRARFLDASAGRWVSRDPLGIWGDAGQNGNAYSLCGNDPVNRVDPFGLRSQSTRDYLADLKTDLAASERAYEDYNNSSLLGWWWNRREGHQYEASIAWRREEIAAIEADLNSGEISGGIELATQRANERIEARQTAHKMQSMGTMAVMALGSTQGDILTVARIIIGPPPPTATLSSFKPTGIRSSFDQTYRGIGKTPSDSTPDPDAIRLGDLAKQVRPGRENCPNGSLAVNKGLQTGEFEPTTDWEPLTIRETFAKIGIDVDTVPTIKIGKADTIATQVEDGAVGLAFGIRLQTTKSGVVVENNHVFNWVALNGKTYYVDASTKTGILVPMQYRWKHGVLGWEVTGYLWNGY
jgi:RHS repeat-associated protein